MLENTLYIVPEKIKLKERFSIYCISKMLKETLVVINYLFVFKTIEVLCKYVDMVAIIVFTDQKVLMLRSNWFYYST